MPQLYGLVHKASAMYSPSSRSLCCTAPVHHIIVVIVMQMEMKMELELEMELQLEFGVWSRLFQLIRLDSNVRVIVYRTSTLDVLLFESFYYIFCCPFIIEFWVCSAHYACCSTASHCSGGCVAASSFVSFKTCPVRFVQPQNVKGARGTY